MSNAVFAAAKTFDNDGLPFKSTAQVYSSRTEKEWEGGRERETRNTAL